MRITAIIPSAGRSRRMRAFVEKPYLLLDEKPILAHTLLSLERSPLVDEVILLVRRSRIAPAKKLVRTFGFKKISGVYAGGASRFESVWQGLKRVPPATDFVLIHDGARPLVTGALIRRVIHAARRYGAAIPVIPVSPTVKRGKGRFVRETLVRKELWEAQTPQVFRKSLLFSGYAAAKKKGITTTDCASLVEGLGQRVRLVAGDPRNLKIATREDLALAAIFIKGKEIKPCAWE